MAQLNKSKYGFSSELILFSLVLMLLLLVFSHIAANMVIFNELTTHDTAAVLMFLLPIALAEQLGVSCMPFVIAVMLVAFTSFTRPLGDQTNLTVFEPCGHRIF